MKLPTEIFLVLCFLVLPGYGSNPEPVLVKFEQLKITSTVHNVDIEIQTDDKHRLVKIEASFKGHKLSIGKAEFDGLDNIDVTSCRILASNGGEFLNGAVFLVLDYGKSIEVDHKEVEMTRAKVVFIFGKNGYDGRKRYVPIEYKAKWNLFFKPGGEPEYNDGDSTARPFEF